MSNEESIPPERDASDSAPAAPGSVLSDSSPTLPRSPAQMSPQIASQPAGPSERVYRWVDVVNKAFQIIAIFVAGIWGIMLFKATNLPSLQPKISVSTELSWKSINKPDVCLAEVVTTVKNSGQVAIEITSASLTVRVHDLDKIDPKTGRPFFFPKDQRNPTLIEATGLTDIDPPSIARSDVGLLNSDLVHSYAPGIENSSSQDLLFQKFDTGLAIVQIDVGGSGPGNFPWISRGKLQDYSYAVGKVCEGVFPGDKMKAPPTANEKK